MRRAIEGALRTSRDDRTPTVGALLAQWEDGTPLPVGAFDGDSLHRAQQLSGSDEALPDSADQTFALDATFGDDPADTEPAQAPSVSSLPAMAQPTWRGRLLLFAVGAVVAVPMFVGVLSLVFGDVLTPMMAGGLFQWLTALATVTAIGLGGVLGHLEREGKPLWLAWFVPPFLLVAIGAAGTVIGLWSVPSRAAGWTVSACRCCRAGSRWRCSPTSPGSPWRRWWPSSGATGWPTGTPGCRFRCHGGAGRGWGSLCSAGPPSSW